MFSKHPLTQPSEKTNHYQTHQLNSSVKWEFAHYVANFLNRTETKFIKQKFKMLFLLSRCNLSRLGKLSPVKWIASNCGRPTSNQN